MQQKHIEKFHLSRLIFTSLLGVALLFSRASTSAIATPLTQPAGTQNVLAYATGISISGLLTAGNASRTANGLTSLTLSTQLNNSAQAKANDMIAKNYWDHVTPDGTQPWYFFDQAGYAYTAAGENLAYGFDTSDGVTIGWMNSPSHRDNMLGNYTEVGYGIASGANYQGGENTVVVAHYGKPAAAVATTPAPAVTPAEPTKIEQQSATPTTTPAAQPTAPTTSSTPAETQIDTQTKTETQTAPNQETADTKQTSQPVKTTESTEKVSVLQQLSGGKVNTPIAISLGIATISTAGLAATHRRFVQKVIEAGKKVALHHPLIDISLISLTLGLILSTTVGHLL